ncbi:MAG: hypothetical protein KGD57_09695 [Candidatus Lokiarchaeota archaeon]|nr:hypothetical protein [Candidatus Lokiarchaeota archaeon]
MVLIKSGKTYIKILYWGMYASGKTTILDTLYKLTKEDGKHITPVGELTKIERASGSTLYFDRGLFQSIGQKKVYYMTYTVSGQRSFSALRKKVFEGTDGIIFVTDSQSHLLEENIEYLKELKSLSQDRLINEIPLIIMLNKQDLNNVIRKSAFIEVLKRERLWFNSGSALSIWNPKVYETCALFDKKQNIYQSFHECARRTLLYSVRGEGRAPLNNIELDIEIDKIQ